MEMTTGVETQLSPGRCPRCGGLSVVRRNTIPNDTLWCDDCRQVTWTYGHYPVPPTTETRGEESAYVSSLTNFRIEYIAPTKPGQRFEPSCAILADSSEFNGKTVRVFDVPDPDQFQRAIAEKACRALNNFDALISALENLVAADNCNYDREVMRSEGYFDAARRTLDEAKQIRREGRE